VRRFPILVFSVVTAAVTCCGLAAGAGPAMGATPAAASHRAAAAAAAGGSWGTAQEVAATLNTGAAARATVNSVSCKSAGNCTAGGSYTDSSGHGQAFVVDETSGTWGQARAVPGMAALNAGGNAQVTSVSCASAGNCTAGGSYTDSSGHGQAFVVDETTSGGTGGTWGTAQEVPGTATLNAGNQFAPPQAVVTSVSCASAGNCTAGGWYTGSNSQTQAFVVDKTTSGGTGGTWGTAQQVPGTATLGYQGNAQVASVSCASAGNCAVVGNYGDSGGGSQVFVVDETSGTWGQAKEVPGTAALNTSGAAQVASVSCASAGNCATGGSYSGGGAGVFVADKTSGGTWGTAQQVPGIATLSGGTGGLAQVTSVSCASAGNCTAGGWYQEVSSGHKQVFVVNETGGTWGTAQAVPSLATLNAGGNAQVTSVSCASAGNCAAGGYYSVGSNRTQAFVVDETGGTWGKAQAVPGTAALNTGIFAQVTSVSCASAGNCAAGGSYKDSSGHTQAFVVDETQAQQGTVTVTPPPSQSTTIGGSADLQVHATDTAGGTLTFTATGLPTGVPISSTGRITGWPTTAGTYHVTVTATDALQASGSATFSWTVSNAPNQGPAGQVWLQNGGKCLDDPGGRTANGTRPQIWTCLGNTNQRWTVVQDGTLRAHGTSACLAENGTGNGSAVVLEACNGGSAQRWQAGTNGELVNTASGRCLDDTGRRTANGTLPQIWACGGGTNQHWIPAAAAIMSGIPGKCVDDTGSSTANGTRLQIWACTGAGNQRWTVQPDGTIRVSGKCLDVVGHGTTSGSPLDIWSCTGASNQHWKIVPEGPFGSEVVNPASNKCLADTGDSTANGTKLTIQNCQAQDPGTIWHVL
jgi:Ricin-type beta-trefoil lectin domain/Putative Ig domain